MNVLPFDEDFCQFSHFEEIYNCRYRSDVKMGKNKNKIIRRQISQIVECPVCN